MEFQNKTVIIACIQLNQIEEGDFTIKYFLYNLSEHKFTEGLNTINSFKINYEARTTLLINDDAETKGFFNEYFFLKHDGFFPSNIEQFKSSLFKSSIEPLINYEKITVKYGSILLADPRFNHIEFNDQNQNFSLDFSTLTKFKKIPSRSILIVYENDSFLNSEKPPFEDFPFAFLMKLNNEEMDRFRHCYLGCSNTLWERGINRTETSGFVSITHKQLVLVMHLIKKSNTTDVFQLIESYNLRAAPEYYIDNLNETLHNEPFQKEVKFPQISSSVIIDKAIMKIVTNSTLTGKSTLNNLIQFLTTKYHKNIYYVIESNDIDKNHPKYLHNKPLFVAQCRILGSYGIEKKSFLISSVTGAIASTKMQSEHNSALAFLRNLPELEKLIKFLDS